MWQSRTVRMLGEEAVKALGSASVAVFGLGGVGSYTVEALARAGVGKLTLIDCDTVDESNINRQLIALQNNVGEDKTEAAEKRVHAINPDCVVKTVKVFYAEDTQDSVDFTDFRYAADCIDSVKSKLLIIKKALENNVYIISSMGTGNKIDPAGLCISDISKTCVCPLARVMRRELKNMGISHLPVLFSKELPFDTEGRVPGSISFVPSVAGLMIAGEIIRKITGITPKY